MFRPSTCQLCIIHSYIFERNYFSWCVRSDVQSLSEIVSRIMSNLVYVHLK